ncbi:hypothetical protein CAAN1_13S00606 [[Candida] anglica]|uniref:Uncharacterized protein n=1 Tax=[Candida] anglica TaxID=148631 RepID=A0ABP0EFX9_9ASCO
MSDAGRQSLGDKVSAAVKPDSEKSTPEHIKDSVVGSVDNAAGHATTDNNKSILQQASDAVFGESK